MGEEKKISLRDSVLANLEVYRVDEINSSNSETKVGKILSKKEVISLFEAISAGNNWQYYVGITGRVREREEEHNAKFLAVIGCPSVDEANELEELAKANGFYTGDATGNGHDEETTKLYIYEIIPGLTKE